MSNKVTAASVEARVREALIEMGADEDAISRDAGFEGLDIDSLDLVELGQIIDEEFGVELSAEDAPLLATMGDAIDLVVSRAASQASAKKAAQ